MTKDEALKLALRSIRELIVDESDDAPALQGVRIRKLAAEKAIKEALAQPEQEPVAWMQNTTAGLYVIDHYDEWHCIPLYTTPPQEQQSCDKRKPLTDVAIATVYWGATGQSLRPQDNALAHKFARAIEAAHGIKGDA